MQRWVSLSDPSDSSEKSGSHFVARKTINQVNAMVASAFGCKFYDDSHQSADLRHLVHFFHHWSSHAQKSNQMGSVIRWDGNISVLRAAFHCDFRLGLFPLLLLSSGSLCFDFVYFSSLLGHVRLPAFQVYQSGFLTSHAFSLFVSWSADFWVRAQSQLETQTHTQHGWFVNLCHLVKHMHVEGL